MFISACAQNICLQDENKRLDADATLQQHVRQLLDSERPTRCWCVVSVHHRPKSWYDLLALSV